MAAISQTQLASCLQEEAIKEADEAADEYVEADEDEDDDEEEEEIEYLDDDEVKLGEVPVLPLHCDDLAQQMFMLPSQLPHGSQSMLRSASESIPVWASA